MPPPPAVDRRIIEALLAVELPRAGDRRLVLVHGRYQDQAAEFTARVGEVLRRVRVTDQPSVLGIVEAWQQHQADPGAADDVLVVTTGVDDAQLGWDLRGHAVGRATRTVDRAEIVRQRFGAADLDPRIRGESWLVDALLAAEPPGGWPRDGAVLTRDAAVRALLRVRLGPEVVGTDAPGAGAFDAGSLGSGVLDAGVLDADALLAWSRSPSGPARFAELPEAERAGLTRWLTETVGGVAPVLLGLAASGRAADALPLGVVGSVLTGPGASAEAALGFAGLLGDVRPRSAELRAFTTAVEATLRRWVAEAASGSDDDGDGSGSGSGSGSGAGAGAGARQRVLDVLARADRLAAEAELTGALAGNRFLPSGFQARLRRVAAALSPQPSAGGVAAAQTALAELREHHLAALFPQRVCTAEAALRLVRWLTTPEPPVESVAAGVRRQVSEWGWVDRALGVVWAGDPVADPAVGRAYRAVYQAARARRDTLDQAFAERLAAWTGHACTQAPGGCLLVEDVLARVALPLAGVRAPLIVLLDGMSSAVAAEFGEQLARRSWVEVSPGSGPMSGSGPVPGPVLGQRAAAVSVIPSVTSVSRASLLTGRLTGGDQASEKDGFTAFWRRHRRGAVLLHKAEIGGGAGHRLAEPLVEALAGDDVVGVVLNTIDDALRHGREGDRTRWRLADVTYLPELLAAARSYGRPVLLVADHGHVLDRSGAGSGTGSGAGSGAGLGGRAGPGRRAGLVAASGVESARWRTGTPEDGEVELSGPRVLCGNGRVVAAWREDIRYTPRRSGYHGGASLAEMTVPVLAVLPSAELLPSGWSVLPPELTTPPWWEPRPGAAPGPGDTARPGDTAGPGDDIPGEPGAAEHERTTHRTPAHDTPGMSAGHTGHECRTHRTPAQDTPGGAWEGCGDRVVGSATYARQRQFVRKPPPPSAVAAVIDALLAADGTLSLAAVAARAGRAGRNPDGFVAVLQRLLNVERYPVLGLADGGRAVRLDRELLRQQFGLDRS